MWCCWDIFKAVSASLSMGPFYSTVNHCACSDEAWPDVEATHKWYSMTVSMKERTFVQRGQDSSQCNYGGILSKQNMTQKHNPLFPTTPIDSQQHMDPYYGDGTILRLLVRHFVFINEIKLRQTGLLL